MEKWFVLKKGADFNGIGERFQISPVLARLIRNREIKGDAEIEKYLNGSRKDLYDPHLFKDVEKLTDILIEKIADHAKIRIIGDYDTDGVMSTYILWKSLKRCGAEVSTKLPERLTDGYGLNENLIKEAYEDGIDTILTCDNGISAISEIAYAKSLGMTVLVTDHHDIPYEETKQGRVYKKSQADAIVNPKQPDCNYPFDKLCGAAVAWKTMQVLYEKMGFDVSECDCFLEHVGFATVGDVMDLVDENRILVKEGLKRIHHTQNMGMRALILRNKLNPEDITAYHIGFVLGPCVNASGRIDTAKRSLELFMQEDAAKAALLAAELVELNTQRKEMTEQGVEEAKCQVEKENARDTVLVLFLPDVHESLAGIIAGRIRESFHKPVFVLTRSADGVKGSGRSIEEYSMYEEMCKCQEFFTKFGGHPMAAGLSMKEEDVDAFRKRINDLSPLKEENMVQKVRIDMQLPFSYLSEHLVHEIERLEPFGKGNTKPLFAERNVAITKAMILGTTKKVLRLNLMSESGERISAVYFEDIEDFIHHYVVKYGEESWKKALQGRENPIRMSMVYQANLNEYKGVKTVQAVIKNYQ